MSLAGLDHKATVILEKMLGGGGSADSHQFSSGRAESVQDNPELQN